MNSERISRRPPSTISVDGEFAVLLPNRVRPCRAPLSLFFFFPLIFFAYSFLVTSAALAHPVTFKGGTALTLMHAGDRTEIEAGHSLSNSLAAAFRFTDESYKDLRLISYLPQLNYKVFRKNTEDSQSNLYASLALGQSRFDDHRYLSTQASLQADYETRRIYTLLSVDRLEVLNEFGLTHVKYRVGVAPYKNNFEEPATWLIAQIEYTPQNEEEWTFTPLIRLFYESYLLELGSSTRGDIFVTAMVHF